MVMYNIKDVLGVPVRICVHQGKRYVGMPDSFQLSIREQQEAPSTFVSTHR